MAKKPNQDQQDKAAIKDIENPVAALKRHFDALVEALGMEMVEEGGKVRYRKVRKTNLV